MFAARRPRAVFFAQKSDGVENFGFELNESFFGNYFVFLEKSYKDQFVFDFRDYLQILFQIKFLQIGGDDGALLLAADN